MTEVSDVSADAAAADAADAGQQLASILEETEPASEEGDATEADATGADATEAEDANVGRALVLEEVVERARERRLSQHDADDEKIALGMEVLLRLRARGTRELRYRRATIIHIHRDGTYDLIYERRANEKRRKNRVSRERIAVSAAWFESQIARAAARAARLAHFAPLGPEGVQVAVDQMRIALAVLDGAAAAPSGMKLRSPPSLSSQVLDGARAGCAGPDARNRAGRRLNPIVFPRVTRAHARELAREERAARHMAELVRAAQGAGQRWLAASKHALEEQRRADAGVFANRVPMDDA